MSQSLSPITKRDILYGVKKTTPEALQNYAREFESLGWLSDAADFWAQAKSLDGLRQLRARAVEEGDSFLFFKIERHLGDTETPSDELTKCAQNAERLGKNRYALKAYEKLGQQEAVDRIRALIAKDGDIVAEAESTVFIPASEDELVDQEESD